ncbi:hypothetical protein Tco_1554744 [Tanacetum coccineum]
MSTTEVCLKRRYAPPSVGMVLQILMSNKEMVTEMGRHHGGDTAAWRQRRWWSSLDRDGSDGDDVDPWWSRVVVVG